MNKKGAINAGFAVFWFCMLLITSHVPTITPGWAFLFGVFYAVSASVNAATAWDKATSSTSEED